MTARTFIHDPNAELDYAVDWSTWLAGGETITTSVWIIPDGIVEGDTSNTTTIATVWLSGGTAGQQYAVTNRITTNQGRTDDRTINLLVQHR